jgi:hypothetical protein
VAAVADSDPTEAMLADLRAQLQQSRQQQKRLSEALTRVLSLVEQAERP